MRLLAWHRALLDAAGPRKWWPGRTRLEIILGAILTQHTAWVNAARAIASLRQSGLLRWDSLREADVERLEECIRPSGAFRQKTRKVRALVRTVEERFGGSLRRMGRAPTDELRAALLATWGIGPETADSILLYAFGRPVFVVDAYTLRVLVRHRLLPPAAGYESARAFLEEHLPSETTLFNEFHAQFVWVGQRHCGTRARCDCCPLQSFLPSGADPSTHDPLRKRRTVAEPVAKREVPESGPRGAPHLFRDPAGHPRVETSVGPVTIQEGSGIVIRKRPPARRREKLNPIPGAAPGSL